MQKVPASHCEEMYLTHGYRPVGAHWTQAQVEAFSETEFGEPTHLHFYRSYGRDWESVVHLIPKTILTYSEEEKHGTHEETDRREESTGSEGSPIQEWRRRMINPYLTEFEKVQKLPGMAKALARDPMVRRYGFAIPCEEAIRVLIQHAPIVEIGAGLGYWASLVQAHRAEHIPYDNNTDKWWDEPGSCCFTKVEHGNTRAILRHPKHTLFLCWPPYWNRMSELCLKRYTGDTFIFVGEGYGSSTGNDAFHDLLCEEWDVEKMVTIPQWDGIRDYMVVYRRLGR